jgi:hypothetical protein
MKTLISVIALLLISLPAFATPDKTCERAAAYQVSGEPGIHECLSHKTMSADCKAVMMASMNKRIHECRDARRLLLGD